MIDWRCEKKVVRASAFGFLFFFFLGHGGLVKGRVGFRGEMGFRDRPLTLLVR